MKILVISTGPHAYVQPNTNEYIPHNRPAVVTQTEFISTKLAKKDLDLLSADLSEDATDEEFEKYFLDSDHDVELATQAFLKEFGPKEAKTGKKKATKSTTPSDDKPDQDGDGDNGDAGQNGGEGA